MNDIEQMARLEALLFVAGDPLTYEEIAAYLSLGTEEAASLVEQLKRRYQRDPMSGLVVRRIEGAASIATKPALSDTIEAFFGKVRDLKLTDAAYETLAVIAYNAPATRAEIEAVRGVNSDSIVNRLIERGLVREVGTLETPGRPALLNVIETFLMDFGLSSTKELPPVDLMMYDTITEFTEERQSAAP